jgi:hypothetical protein
MVKVGSAAKLAGENIDSAKKAALDLAKDGTLGVTEASEAMQGLLSLGLSVEKAFEFAEAGKRVATFEGVLGTAAESFTSFVKGLRTGEATLESLSPEIEQMIKRLGGFEKVASNATLRMQVINRVIEKGSILQNDYNNFLDSGAARLARMGKKFEELLIKIGNLEAVKSLVETFSKLVDVLSKIVTETAKAEKALTKFFTNRALESAKELAKERQETVAIVDIGLGAPQVATLKELDALIQAGKEPQVLFRVFPDGTFDDIKNLRAALGTVENKIKKATTTTTTNTKKKVKEIIKLTDFLLNDFEKRLRANEKQFFEFTLSIDKLVAKGLLTQKEAIELSQKGYARLLELQAEVIRNETTVVNTFLDRRLKIELDNINIQEQRAIEAIKNKANMDIKFAKIAQNEIEKIQQTARKKRLTAELNNAKETIDRINQATGGLRDILQADSGGGFISGFGRVAGAVDPVFGGIVSGVGGIVGAFEDIFGAGDDLKRQEEERQRQIKITTDLIKSEKEFQEEILKIQQQRSKLLTVEAERQISLNNLIIKDEEKRNRANTQVLKDLVQIRAGEIGISETQPEAIASRINKLAQEQLNNQAALRVVQGITTAVNASGFFNTSQASDQSISQLKQLSEAGLSPGIQNLVNETVQQLQNATRITLESGVDIKGLIQDQGKFGVVSPEISAIQQAFFSANALAERIKTGISDIGLDVERGDELLRLLKRIQDQEKQFSTTAQELQFGRDREVSFVDVGRGGLLSLGQFQQARIDTTALAAPSQIQSVAVATERQKSIQERQLDKLVDINNVLLEIRDINNQIEKNTQNPALLTQDQLIFGLESLGQGIQ